MPTRSHDTASSTHLQTEYLGSGEWEDEVLTRLPPTWEQQAETLHAFERSRHLRHPADLLRGVLAYVLCVSSFRHLGCWGVLQGLGNLSDTAWRKRLRRATDWLEWMLHQLLSIATGQFPWLVQSGYRRVVLLDATHLTCRGPLGMVWRLHCAFDLLAGRLTHVKVTDRHTAEDLELFDIQPGDLIISDNANGYRERLFHVLKAKADLLVRFSVNTLPLHDEQGHLLDLLRWLKGRHAPAGRIVERTAFIEQDGQRQQVRCVALRLTAEQTQQAQRRKRGKARRAHRQLSPETLYLAGWLLVVTTVPSERLSAVEVLRLYRARWHIELLFKRIKQLLDLHRLRCTTAATARATLCALLLAWVLQEDELQEVRLRLQELQQPLQASEREIGVLLSKPVERPVSQWMLNVLGVAIFRQQVAGVCSLARLRACLPQLQRFLCGSPRRRDHLYSQVWSWLAAPPPMAVLT